MKKSSLTLKFLIFMLIESVPFVLDVIFYKSGAVDEVFWLLPTLIAVSILNFFIFRKASHFVIMQASILLLGSLCQVLETVLWNFYVCDDGWGWAFCQLYIIISTVALVLQTIVGYILAKPR